MNKRMKKLVLSAVMLCFLISCGHKANQPVSTEVVGQKPSQTKDKVLGVNKKAYLLIKPSENTNKIVNEKYKAATGKIDYLQIDNSCKVKVLEENAEWVKVQVVDPDWLSQTHIGWVKKDVIAFKEVTTKLPNLKENRDFKLLFTNDNNSVENHYVLILRKDLSENSLHLFAKSYKKAFDKSGRMNLYVYDTDKLGKLIKKDIAYQLNDAKEYIKLADHFVYMSSFDDMDMYYPYQDLKYKECGGKNWKIEPIE